MADNTSTKLNPADEASASTELRKNEFATNLATNPLQAQGGPSASETEGEKPATYTDMATNAASAAVGTASTAAANVKDSVFSMFGGGAKKEKKAEEDEPTDEKSGSSKAKAAEEDEGDDDAEKEADVHFEPVVHLTEQVPVKTNEENEEATFKIRAKLFRFDRESKEWKERGTGEVRFLKHNDNKKIRLVMRRDKTHKVCANHYIVPDMKLSPNVGSDRSWVWNAAADVSEGDTEAVTLAIRLANPENANLFKEAFLKSQQENESAFPSSSSTEGPKTE